MRLTPLGELTALPRPLAVFEGAASRQGRRGESKGGERKGRKKKKGGEERGEKGKGREMDPRNFENRSTPMVTTDYLIHILTHSVSV